MIELHPFPERIQKALEPTGLGVVGLVEALLALSRDEGLQLDWHADRCHARRPGAGPTQSAEVPLRKSVFRAILARVAALCNERAPSSVSPYGGQGELAVDSCPPTVIRVAFVNTPGEQRLELTPVRQEGGPAMSEAV
jgi:hypothetical protein